MGVRKSALGEGRWLLEALGRLDAAAVPELEEALQGLLAEGEVSLIIDLSQASYISSSGLKVIVSTWRTLRMRKGQLVLSGLGPRLLEIFEMVGFTQIFKIYPSVAEAERALDAPPVG